nr:hypothetical protein GCM10025732_55910 [Glycomyces mayteni]
MGGEDGADFEALGGGRDLVGGDVFEGDLGAGLGEPAAVLGAGAAHVAGAVDLLGDVREVEVGGERAGEVHFLGDVELREAGGHVLGLVADEAAHLFDEFEQLGPLLADERLAEEVAEAPDVAAELLVVGSAGGVVVVHGGLHCWSGQTLRAARADVLVRGELLCTSAIERCQRNLPVMPAPLSQSGMRDGPVRSRPQRVRAVTDPWHTLVRPIPKPPRSIRCEGTPTADV